MLHNQIMDDGAVTRCFVEARHLMLRGGWLS